MDPTQPVTWVPTYVKLSTEINGRLTLLLCANSVKKRELTGKQLWISFLFITVGVAFCFFFLLIVFSQLRSPFFSRFIGQESMSIMQKSKKVIFLDIDIQFRNFFRDDLLLLRKVDQLPDHLIK